MPVKTSLKSSTHVRPSKPSDSKSVRHFAPRKIREIWVQSFESYFIKKVENKYKNKQIHFCILWSNEIWGKNVDK